MKEIRITPGLPSPIALYEVLIAEYKDQWAMESGDIREQKKMDIVAFNIGLLEEWIRKDAETSGFYVSGRFLDDGTYLCWDTKGGCKTYVPQIVKEGLDLIVVE